MPTWLLAENGQPVLLGTVSIEKSEKLPRSWSTAGSSTRCSTPSITPGRPTSSPRPGARGAVTVATNMAGRGVDIKLGGNPDGMARTELKRRGITHDDPSYEELEQKLTQEFEDQITPDKQRVIDAGGLYVVGTERHESRRIDNQLRGRSARQGTWVVRFYLTPARRLDAA